MAWLRLYDSILDDPKIQMLSDKAFRALINLWCLAKRNGGKLPADIRSLAFSLRWPEGKVRETLQALISARLIDKTETGYEPHDWKQHQYESDVSTERVKRFRERHVNGSAKHLNGATETPPDTESEAETETNTPADAGSAPVSKPKARKRTEYVPDFEAFWKAYEPPLNSTKADAFLAWMQTAEQRPPLEQLLNAVRAHNAWIAEESRKRKSEHPKKLAETWLRKQAWTSFLTVSVDPAKAAAQLARRDQILGRSITETPHDRLS